MGIPTNQPLICACWRGRQTHQAEIVGSRAKHARSIRKRCTQGISEANDMAAPWIQNTLPTASMISLFEHGWNPKALFGFRVWRVLEHVQFFVLQAGLPVGSPHPKVPAIVLKNLARACEECWVNKWLFFTIHACCICCRTDPTCKGRRFIAQVAPRHHS